MNKMSVNTKWFRQVATKVVAVAVALTAPIAYAAPLSPTVIAQAALQIQNFRSELVSDLSPGTDLVFTVEATPRAKANLTIGTSARNVTMQEIEPGIYEGHYTIRRSDRISNSTPVRVTLRRGNQTATARLNQPLIETATNFDPNADTNETTIKQFTVDPIENLEPGTELVFRVIGTSRAKVSFTITGVVRNRAMDEINPGTYEGHYTVRRNDRIPVGVVIIALLKNGGQTVQSRLNGGLVNDKEPPTVQNLFPADSSVATTDRPKISGVFDDGRGTGVDPKSVRIRFDGRDVTRGARITATSFNYQLPRALLPGQYRVEVDLKDLAGNVGRSTWAFDVTRQVAAQPLFIKILSPANNSTIPVGQIVVRGQSSPGALVSLDVQAASSVVGFLGYSQKVFNESVQADAQGNFTFQFQSVVSFQGTRYELLFNATKDNESRQERWVLIQK
ncbi:MAG: hypothetical protein H7Y37_10780 [Anaerolineae bacterium]|nr:hypothetical protein [Gloeobacterales cyanobacterium ES-bin-313]